MALRSEALQKPDRAVELAEATDATSSRVWCRDRWLDLSRPVVMGVMNITPDSFSDGGRFHFSDDSLDLVAIEAAACAMLDAGASLLDIGGESTRPGALQVEAPLELARVIPVMERLSGLATLLSVDTRKFDVAAAAIAKGCRFINDVSAGSDPRMFKLVAESGVGICLMHMQGQPQTMQDAPGYHDVVAEVRTSLLQRVDAALQAGVRSDQIVLDPGIGFGKRVADNLELLSKLEQITDCGFPVLVGVSRKSTIGHITGRPVSQRLAGSVAMAALLAERGAKIIRAHDVAETVDALAIQQALQPGG